MHATITKYSCNNGNKAAASKFSAELGHVVTESTVCNIKKAYFLCCKRRKTLTKSKACRMLLGGDRCSYGTMTKMSSYILKVYGRLEVLSIAQLS